MSFPQRKFSINPDLIFLVRGSNKGRPCWHYIQVSKHRLEVFKRNMNSGKVILKEYGKILFSGWGQNPPSEVQSKLKAMCGI